MDCQEIAQLDSIDSISYIHLSEIKGLSIVGSIV